MPYTPDDLSAALSAAYSPAKTNLGTVTTDMTEEGVEPQPQQRDLSYLEYGFDVLKAVPKGVVNAARDVVELGNLPLQAAGLTEEVPEYFGLFDPPETAAGSIVDTLAGFLTGYGAVAKGLGVAGRVGGMGMRAAKAARAAEIAALQNYGRTASKAVKIGTEFARTSTISGIASGLVFDGHEERLSNILREYAGFTDPVTEFLAADENDTELEGRLKNMMEDFLLGGVAELGIQAVKATTRGMVNSMRVHRAGVKAKLAGQNPDEAIAAAKFRISEEQAEGLALSMNTTLDEAKGILRMIDATGAARENFEFMTRTEVQEWAAKRGLNFDELDAEARGFTTINEAGKVIIGGLKGADLDTAIHEVSHGIRMMVVDPTVANKVLRKQDIDFIGEFVGATKNADGTWKWTTEAEENFVTAFQRYLYEGAAPSRRVAGVFNQMTNWLRNLYRDLDDVEINAILSPEVRQAFDNLVMNGVDGTISGGRGLVGDTAAATLFQSRREVEASPEFKQWFSGSEVTDDSGRPMVAYHVSRKVIDIENPQDSMSAAFARKGDYAFDEFSSFRPGSHFGTSKAANDRFSALTGHDGKGMYYDKTFDREAAAEGMRTYPVYLSIKNPLRVPDEAATSQATLFDEITRGQKVGRYLEIDIDHISPMSGAGTYDAVENAGYDGLVYKNEVEDLGVDSYVVFNPNQVKSIFNRRGFTEDPRLLYQRKKFDAKAALPEDAKDLEDLLDEEEWASIKSQASLDKTISIYRRFEKELLPLFRAASEAGAAVQGGYEEGAVLMEEIVGRPAKELFAMFSAATSPQNKVPSHTRLGVGIAADVVTRVMRGDLSDFTKAKMEAIVKSAGKRLKARGIVTDYAKRSRAVANDLMERLREAKKDNPKASTADLLQSVDMSGLYKNMRGAGLELGAGKVPGFAEGSAGRLNKVVLDTYMARLIPDDMFPGVSGKKLLDAKKQWLSKAPNYMAMAAMVRKLSNQMGVLPGQTQERVWGSIYVISALKRAGVPDDKILKNLSNEDMVASWNLLSILKAPEVTNELRRLGATEESLESIDSIAAAIRGRVRPNLERAIEISNVGAAEELARRVPRASGATGTEVIAARKARGAEILLQARRNAEGLSVKQDEALARVWDVPVSKAMQEFEEAHVGGIADLGDPEAKNYIPLAEGFEKDIAQVRTALRKELGESFTMYRSMSKDQLAAWRNGEDIGNMSGTLSLGLARRVINFAAVKDKDRVVVSFQVSPDDIVMRGSLNERELVFDGNAISADTVREVDPEILLQARRSPAEGATPGLGKPPETAINWERFSTVGSASEYAKELVEDTVRAMAGEDVVPLEDAIARADPALKEITRAIGVADVGSLASFMDEVPGRAADIRTAGDRIMASRKVLANVSDRLATLAKAKNPSREQMYEFIRGKQILTFMTYKVKEEVREVARILNAQRVVFEPDPNFRLLPDLNAKPKDLPPAAAPAPTQAVTPGAVPTQTTAPVAPALDPAGKAATMDSVITDAGGEAAVRTEMDKYATAAATGNPMALVRLSRTQRVGNVLVEYFMNSILSNPVTQVVNVLGTGTTAFYLPIERMLGASLRGDFRTVGSQIRHLNHLMHVGVDAFSFAGAALKSGQNVLEEVGTSEVKTNAISAAGLGMAEDSLAGQAVTWLGKALNVPSRFLTTTDEFFKQLNYRAALMTELEMEGLTKFKGDHAAAQAWAAETYDKMITDGQQYAEKVIMQRAMAESDKAVANGTITAEERTTFIAQYMSDQKNWDPRLGALSQRALDYARYSTFTTPLVPGEGGAISRISARVQQAVDEHPLARFVIPFIRTPTRILEFTLDRSLPGQAWNLNNAFGKLKGDLTHAKASVRADAMGRVAFSTLTVFTVGGMFYAGRITGAGPENQAERDAWLQAGNQPYSIKMGDGWVSYRRMDPFASMIGIIVDTMHSYSYANERQRPQLESVLHATIVGLANNITNKSYLTGLTNMVNAIKEPGRFGNNLVNQYVSAAVPFSSGLRQAKGTLDDDLVVRDVRTMGDAIYNTIPGWAQGVAPRRNMFGEAITRPQGVLADMVSPFSYTAVKDDAILKELDQIGHSFAAPREVRNGVDLTTIMNRGGQSAYDRWMELHGQVKLGNRTLRDAMLKTIRSKEYQRLSPETTDMYDSPRVRVMRSLVERYRKAAFKQVMDEFPEVAQGVQRDFAIKRAMKMGRPVQELMDLVNR
jgi:hypothetical protein